MTEKFYVDLQVSNDGDIGLLVIIQAETGVVYNNQVAGTSCLQREVEGCAIPIGNRYRNDYVDNLIKLFESDFNCEPTFPLGVISELQQLVSKIPLWRHSRPTVNADGSVSIDTTNVVHYLELDTDRLDDLWWAWIPVKTPYGPGILTFENCD